MADVGDEFAYHIAVPVATVVNVVELPEQITEPLDAGAEGGPLHEFEQVRLALNPEYTTEISEVNRSVRTPSEFVAMAFGGNVKPVYCPISGAAVEFPS